MQQEEKPLSLAVYRDSFFKMGGNILMLLIILNSTQGGRSLVETLEKTPHLISMF